MSILLNASLTSKIYKIISVFFILNIFDVVAVAFVVGLYCCCVFLFVVVLIIIAIYSSNDDFPPVNTKKQNDWIQNSGSRIQDTGEN